MKRVGIPDGVVNVVPGVRPYGGRAHRRTPRRQAEDRLHGIDGHRAAHCPERQPRDLKKVQLELGGKGPNIVFADADIQASVNGSAWAIFHNQGQACIAGSRLIVHESIVDEFLDRFLKLARSIRLGDPLDDDTEMGPLTSKQHQERVLHFVKVAKQEGGEVLAGGRIPGRDG